MSKTLTEFPLEKIDFNLLPFSPIEANSIKDWLHKSRAGQQKNSAAVVKKYWHEILTAAKIAGINKVFDVTPLKSSIQLGQKLKRIANARRPKNIRLDYVMVTALAFGAARLGFINYPKNSTEALLRKKLSTLSSTAIKLCAMKAMKEPLIPWGPNKTPLISSNKGGYPSHDTLNNYIEIIGNIYCQATRAPLIKSRPEGGNRRIKPALEFISLCIPKKIFEDINKKLIRHIIL